MSPSSDPLQDRFRGCLLGLAIGDALGGKFEAQSADGIRARFPSVEALIAYPQDEIWYTDDTQMAIGVAETLVEHGAIIEDQLCKAFVANYVPSRGYGRGARAVLEAMEEGRDYRQVAEQYFPGGSYGNGAAMRVAPVGLLFRDDRAALQEQARLSALPTHLHPLGIEGAQLLALGVALCSQSKPFDRAAFLRELVAACTSDAYRTRLELASRLEKVDDLGQLGNRIEALDSVPTAIASFALTPESFASTIANVIFLGGDTDTLAAMAGALSGAYLGASGLAQRLVNLIETSPKGRTYLIELADRLLTVYRERHAIKQPHQ
ncbi:MAG: ADP-ribosylglycohydrolase family protein [Planctomycetia bacterium]|nr:ADP-ribosylglycohydrolase family protein [Planctomycetia bacterium]